MLGQYLFDWALHVHRFKDNAVADRTATAGVDEVWTLLAGAAIASFLQVRER